MIGLTIGFGGIFLLAFCIFGFVQFVRGVWAWPFLVNYCAGLMGYPMVAVVGFGFAASAGTRARAVGTDEIKSTRRKRIVRAHQMKLLSDAFFSAYEANSWARRGISYEIKLLAGVNDPITIMISVSPLVGNRQQPPAMPQPVMPQAAALVPPVVAVTMPSVAAPVSAPIPTVVSAAAIDPSLGYQPSAPPPNEADNLYSAAQPGLAYAPPAYDYGTTVDYGASGYGAGYGTGAINF
eukprot:gnl/Ergobibamus_cyprinoides/408.p1 GENE.gnl/Ergobibamus_cyprinoides/408~~gnl/Ergobibamus_cyprinoides/408.p1  ORF type:complete len:237 (+),score=65.83 gnl/Ergobibamus_cyprinoides/408:270-980(+)